MSQREKHAARGAGTAMPATRAARVPRPALGTPGLAPRAGAIAVAGWLAERGIYASGDGWRIDVALTTSPASVEAVAVAARFHLVILPREWRYVFVHGQRVSEIAVADTPRSFGRDDHQLAMSTPTLRKLGTMVRDLERRYQLFFQRHSADVTSTLPGAEPLIRAWLARV